MCNNKTGNTSWIFWRHYCRSCDAQMVHQYNSSRINLVWGLTLVIPWQKNGHDIILNCRLTLDYRTGNLELGLLVWEPCCPLVQPHILRVCVVTKKRDDDGFWLLPLSWMCRIGQICQVSPPSQQDKLSFSKGVAFFASKPRFWNEFNPTYSHAFEKSWLFSFQSVITSRSSKRSEYR